MSSVNKAFGGVKVARFLALAVVAVILLSVLSGCALSGDDTEWVNALTESAMQANFRITTTAINVTNNPILGEIRSSTLFGASGVLFCVRENEFFLLTNNHNISKTGYDEVEYFVTDYKGNEYDKVSVVYSDAAYDLAVISFTTGRDGFAPLTLASENPRIGTRVAAIGWPNERINALTLGRVLLYDVVSVDEDESQVEFDVIYHDAPVYPGSSGSMLLNENLEIVGINFAEGVDDDGGFSHGCAVPVVKVREFLVAAGFVFTNGGSEVKYDKE